MLMMLLTNQYSVRPLGTFRENQPGQGRTNRKVEQSRAQHTQRVTGQGSQDKKQKRKENTCKSKPAVFFSEATAGKEVKKSCALLCCSTAVCACCYVLLCAAAHQS